MLGKIGLALMILLIGRLPILHANETSYQVVCIGFYNLENLFDTLDDPKTKDEEFTPYGEKNWTQKRYQTKLRLLSKVISEIGAELTPDGVMLLGVCEVENKQVLDDLVKMPLIKERGYEIVHENSPDRRGIDVALLYQSSFFKVISYKYVSLRIDRSQRGKAFKSRDQLVVSGEINGDTLHVIVNHWPARYGGQSRSAPLRNAAARLCRSLVDSLIALDSNAKIVVMGDLNDDPVDESIDIHLNAENNQHDLERGELFNTTGRLYDEGIGTLAYRDKWNLFDQLILTQSLLGNDYTNFKWFKSLVFKKPYLIQKEGRYKGYPYRTYARMRYLGGYSDHFPVYMYLIKRQ